MFTLLVQDARCKGSDANLTQMYAAVGNMEIGGQRPALVACGRSLPTFRAYCPSSASRAVVLRSLMDGLRPSRESFVHTASARLGLVIGQLETPISGYNQHCIIRSLNSVVVDAGGCVRTTGNRICSFVYGGHGGDPRKSWHFVLDWTYPVLAPLPPRHFPPGTARSWSFERGMHLRL